MRKALLLPLVVFTIGLVLMFTRTWSSSHTLQVAAHAGVAAILLFLGVVGIRSGVRGAIGSVCLGVAQLPLVVQESLILHRSLDKPLFLSSLPITAIGLTFWLRELPRLSGHSPGRNRHSAS